MNKNTRLSGAPLRRATRFALVSLVAVGLTACGGGKDTAKSTQTDSGQQAHAGQSPPPQPAAEAHPGAAATSGQASAQAGAQAVLAGVGFAPPADWQDLGPNAMRKAQYRLAPVGGDSAPAEVNVFYFGPESGGGVEANLQRWIGQMVLPDGGDPASAAQRSTFTADGMAGHIISLDGSFKSGGGGPMGGSGELLPGYRLVGVVLEGPQGSLFFKLTGPVATAKAMEAQLLSMMKGAARVG